MDNPLTSPLNDVELVSSDGSDVLPGEVASDAPSSELIVAPSAFDMQPLLPGVGAGPDNWLPINVCSYGLAITYAQR